ncbi:hypothetical protein NEMBOFW57_001334 [Staphylotrichum longicolle]|uniref:Glutamine amidotransferase domain-containing protein n=1 Tax=Staphylotrichum longicolle TaxID=669026 RepID=A0AAD4F1G3_9PEZI|nr:hypothetical protein NEMBOFW57_001334 [Staphylotrichum longicolle]
MSRERFIQHEPNHDRSLRIAILLNSYARPSSPRSETRRWLPRPNAFDLIVIGGGNADPRKRHPWILRVHKFILDVVANYPRKKLCGICWGHQTICQLFGADLVDMEIPELGVTESKLTPAGRRFFSRQHGNGSLFLQQHHRREVRNAPRGFTELLVGSQSFLSHNNTILTFQGHPEKDARCAKLRLRDATRWFGVDEDDKLALAYYERAMERQHDGADIWRRVLEWAKERHPSHEIHL